MVFDFAENALITQFLSAKSISGSVLNIFIMKNMKNQLLRIFAYFHYRAYRVNLKVGGALFCQGCGPNFGWGFSSWYKLQPLQPNGGDLSTFSKIQSVYCGQRVPIWAIPLPSKWVFLQYFISTGLKFNCKTVPSFISLVNNFRYLICTQVFYSIYQAK